MRGNVQKILVVGAGHMGQQIAVQIMKHGLNVIVHDISQANLELAKKKIHEFVSELNFNVTSEIKSIDTDCDLVIETVIENIKLKREVLAKLNTVVNKDAIFVSNTSDILPSKIAKYTGRPELFCAYHFHSPLYGANIVDIMPHRRTSPDVVKVLTSFTRTIGLIPLVLKKESPAYIYNAILNSIMDKSVELVLKEVAGIEDVDKAWMGNTGMKIGPFGMLDFIGIDTAMHVTRIRAKKNPLKYIGVAFFKKYVDAGKLGIKSGEGFYKYPNPKYLDYDFLK